MFHCGISNYCILTSSQLDSRSEPRENLKAFSKNQIYIASDPSIFIVAMLGTLVVCPPLPDCLEVVWSWNFRKVCPVCVLYQMLQVILTISPSWPLDPDNLPPWVNKPLVNSTGIMAPPLKGINRKSKYAVDLIVESKHLHRHGLCHSANPFHVAA